jgi:hypothetical protein
MKTRGLTRQPLTLSLIASAVTLLLISACQQASIFSNLPTNQPPATAYVEQATTATPLPAEPTQPPAESANAMTMDLSGVAQNLIVETIAAVPASADSPFWEVAPQHIVVTLQGYSVVNTQMKPQIFIYPVAELAAYNEVSGLMVTDLQTLLQNRQPVEHMPFLPLINASQVMHPQMQFLDFKNGSGVRFLTQFDQAIMPINNQELIYAFQGLTSDGNYYVSAMLPINHAELPNELMVTEEQITELNDFPAYLSKTITWLDQQPGESFTPNLVQLDAMIQSIEMK